MDENKWKVQIVAFEVMVFDTSKNEISYKEIEVNR